MVNSDTFLAILRGERSKLTDKGSGKLLKSGPDDDIFVYFADHGGPEYVNFPNSYLSAQALAKTFKFMHKKNLYKNLLFYLEACNSGSMFEDILPPDIGIMAVSASAPWQSSFACFYNETLNTFMGDVFSALWLQYAERSSHKSQSVLEQILYVTKRSAQFSSTSVYGDLRVGNRSIGTFQGDADTHVGQVFPLLFSDAFPSDLITAGKKV